MKYIYPCTSVWLYMVEYSVARYGYKSQHKEYLIWYRPPTINWIFTGFSSLCAKNVPVWWAREGRAEGAAQKHFFLPLFSPLAKKKNDNELVMPQNANIYRRGSRVKLILEIRIHIFVHLHVLHAWYELFYISWKS